MTSQDVAAPPLTQALNKLLQFSERGDAGMGCLAGLLPRLYMCGKLGRVPVPV